MKFLTFTLTVISIPIYSYTQDEMFLKFTNDKLYGILLSDTDESALIGSHIINVSQNLAAISDSAGAFKINARPTDTIIISCIGYRTLKIKTRPDFSSYNEFNFIWMTPQTYVIEELKIFSLGTWQDFKHKVINLQIEEPYKELKDQLQEDIKREVTDNFVGQPALGINFNFKELKEQKKMAELLHREQMQQVIDKKYNRDIISKLTGLEGKELTQFIAYCNFNHIYLYSAKQYDILTSILIHYDNYIKGDAPPTPDFYE